MKREFIKQLLPDIAEDVLDQIMEEAGKDVESHKQQISTLTRATAVAVKYGTTNGEMAEGLRRYNEAISKFREFERERIAE